MKKYIFITGGIICVSLGFIGVVVPGLPTTPFLLLASFLFYNSSKRMHNALNKSFLGKYINRYNNKKGVPLKTKLTSLLLMWTMMSISIFGVIEKNNIRILVAFLGLIGTLSIIFFVPNEKKND